ncbi:MAG: phage scaffolding protein [Ligilactobacillus saerimneri]|nr:phage scaffolding protein [Ligilactobacillus saerimneri]
MKREFLKKQGLSDEQVKAVMTEYGKDMDKVMEQVNTLTTEKDNLTSQIADRDTQLTKLKEGIQDNADLKDQITKLQQANKQAKKDYEAKMASQKKAFLVDKAINGAGARNSKSVSDLLDIFK